MIEAAAGEPVIFVQQQVAAQDLKSIRGAQGVLTAGGGMTSHTAVVARGWGQPCITGCSDLVVDTSNKMATLGSHCILPGDMLSINGSTGEVITGAVPMATPRVKGYLQRFLSWVDEYRTVGVLANVDTPMDAQLVR